MEISSATIQEVRDRIDIVDLVGRYVELRRRGRDYKGLCPFHDEKTPSFNVSPRRNGFKCFGCGQGGDGIGFVMAIEGKTFPDAVRTIAALYGVPIDNRQPPPRPRSRPSVRRKRETEAVEDDRRRSEIAAEIFERSTVIEEGDPVDLYLRGRGLRPHGAFWPLSLRRGHLKHPDTRSFYPAMVGQIVDVHGQPIAIHRTFLTKDGRKADVPEPKLSYGPLRGGVIRLGVDSASIVVAEGIETAFAAAAVYDGVPWATLSSGNMPLLELPTDVTRVVIAHDRDRNRVGIRAAMSLARKLKELQVVQNRRIRIFLKAPPEGRTDFADFGD